MYHFYDWPNYKFFLTNARPDDCYGQLAVKKVAKRNYCLFFFGIGQLLFGFVLWIDKSRLIARCSHGGIGVKTGTGNYCHKKILFS